MLPQHGHRGRALAKAAAILCAREFEARSANIDDYRMASVVADLLRLGKIMFEEPTLTCLPEGFETVQQDGKVTFRPTNKTEA